MDGTSGNEGLLQNKLFLQFLAAGGEDIGQGNAIGTNTNAVTNQAIKSQNYAKMKKDQQLQLMKMMQMMMGPDNVPGGKASVDDKGIKIDVPSGFFAEPENAGGGMYGMEAKKVGGFEPAAPGAMPNPFGVGQLSSPSDLAGLTPADIDSASKAGMEGAMLPFNINQQMLDSLREDEALDLEGTYKRFLMERARNKDDRPNSVQEWETAKKGGYDKSYEYWMKDEGTDTIDWRNYQHAKDGGYGGTFKEYQGWIRKQGATNISMNPLAKQVEQTKLKGYEYFGDPDWADDVNKFVANAIDTSLDPLILDPDADPNYIARFGANKAIEFVEQRITSGRGEIVDITSEGNTIIWKVKWPSEYTKDIEEYRYEVKF